MDSEKLTQTIILKDGRKLGFAEFGKTGGKPVFYFHGKNSSRLEPKMYDIEKKQVNVRLISVDRPGMGISDFQENRTIINWPDDIRELADQLKIEKFSVLGGSGGAPYALACAYKIPDLLHTCGIVSGLGPVELGTEGMNKEGKTVLKLGRKLPGLLKFMYKLQGSMLKSFQKKDEETLYKLFKKKADKLPEPDRKIITARERTSLNMELMSEAFRQGINGPFHDAKLFGNDWGFKLEEIPKSVKVFSWHGELDNSVPIKMARSVCEAIPNCKSEFYSDEAHMSTAVNKIVEILDTLDENA
ncbi:MAG: alpha/beta hydrolase [Candidatus Hodarchaeota archaeon]